jgi:putative isomerase
MKKSILLITILLVNLFCGSAQTISRNIKTSEYRELQKNLGSGWNTWYNNSVMSHVLLPEGFSINLCISTPGKGDYLREVYKASKFKNRPEEVKLGLRSDDGSYTSLTIRYMNQTIEVSSATEGNDELIVVTPKQIAANQLIIEAGLLWGKDGTISKENGDLTGRFPSRIITIHTTESQINDGYIVSSSPNIIIPLNREIGIYTGRVRSLSEIKTIIEKKRKIQEERISSYNDLSEPFRAMQTILAWNTIYDAPNDRVISPVSRNWNLSWGGFVLFDWDTYFASYMCSLFNKNLACANAIEITKAITPSGFIPNFQAPFGYTSWDRSQPPVGSTIILAIYNRYREKWFLEEVYTELLSWNRWWPEKRDINGYLVWGSDNVPDSLKLRDNSINTMQAAKYESGLDNSNMYDDVPFNKQTGLMELADVGLMSLYIMDCNSLAEIAINLGHRKDAEELIKRSAKYTEKLKGMWDEEAGIFLNKRLDNGEKSLRISPTNFYPMLAKACSQKQAEIMIKKHYFNPAEFYGEFVIPSSPRNDPAFNDNDYWRGRIWAPMNFLVYLGMRNYNLPEARKDLIEKSKALLMKSWNEDGSIYENYNGATGQGNDVRNADGFYHWGALLTFMSFIENGLMQSDQTTNKPLK